MAAQIVLPSFFSPNPFPPFLSFSFSSSFYPPSAFLRLPPPPLIDPYSSCFSQRLLCQSVPGGPHISSSLSHETKHPLFRFPPHPSQEQVLCENWSHFPRRMLRGVIDRPNQVIRVRLQLSLCRADTDRRLSDNLTQDQVMMIYVCRSKYVSQFSAFLYVCVID